MLSREARSLQFKRAWNVIANALRDLKAPNSCDPGFESVKQRRLDNESMQLMCSRDLCVPSIARVASFGTTIATHCCPHTTDLKRYATERILRPLMWQRLCSVYAAYSSAQRRTLNPNCNFSGDGLTSIEAGTRMRSGNPDSNDSIAVSKLISARRFRISGLITTE